MSKFSDPSCGSAKPVGKGGVIATFVKADVRSQISEVIDHFNGDGLSCGGRLWLGVL